MNKTTRAAIEKSIKFIEEQTTECVREMGNINKALRNTGLATEIAYLKQEYKRWQQLYNEAETALLFLKTQLIFEEEN